MATLHQRKLDPFVLHILNFFVENLVEDEMFLREPVRQHVVVHDVGEISLQYLRILQISVEHETFQFGAPPQHHHEDVVQNLVFVLDVQIDDL